LQEKKLSVDERTAKIQPGRRILQAFQMGTSDAEIGQRIVKIVVPFLVSLARFRCDDTGCELSILREVRHLGERDGLDTVDGHSQPERTRSWIGYVYGVDQESTVIFSVTCDSHTAVASTNNTGNQG